MVGRSAAALVAQERVRAVLQEGSDDGGVGARARRVVQGRVAVVGGRVRVGAVREERAGGGQLARGCAGGGGEAAEGEVERGAADHVAG